jgi:hypothetical protein
MSKEPSRKARWLPDNEEKLRVALGGRINNFSWYDMCHHFASCLAWLNTVRALFGYSNLNRRFNMQFSSGTHSYCSKEINGKTLTVGY